MGAAWFPPVFRKRDDMPLADTSVHFPVLAPLGAWNVALQHMDRAGAQLEGHAASGPVNVPVAGTDLAGGNAALSRSIAGHVVGATPWPLPTVYSSGAATDLLYAVRVLQAGQFEASGDARLAQGAREAIALLSTATGAIGVVPSPESIDRTKTLLAAAVRTYPA